jgi:hypothetical protein
MDQKIRHSSSLIDEKKGCHKFLNLSFRIIMTVFFRVILLESRPTDTPSAESNLYVLAGHENNF